MFKLNVLIVLYEATDFIRATEVSVAKIDYLRNFTIKGHLQLSARQRQINFRIKGLYVCFYIDLYILLSCFLPSSLILFSFYLKISLFFLLWASPISFKKNRELIYPWTALSFKTLIVPVTKNFCVIVKLLKH